MTEKKREQSANQRVPIEEEREEKKVVSLHSDNLKNEAFSSPLILQREKCHIRSYPPGGCIGAQEMKKDPLPFFSIFSRWYTITYTFHGNI